MEDIIWTILITYMLYKIATGEILKAFIKGLTGR